MRLPNLTRQALLAYPIPLLVTLACFAAGHLLAGPWLGPGRPGWAVLLLCLPWTAARILVLCRTGGVVINRQQRRVAGALALIYPPVALACAGAIAFAMGHTQLAQAKEYLLLLFFPFTLPVML